MSRAATSRLKVNAPLGLRPSLENCRIPDLNVDAAYQRSTEAGPSVTLIRRIAMFWDWSLFHPLSVARRPDGSLWVVDGQHRLAAARLRRDLYDLPCVVSHYASVDEEAASFVAMNMARRPLSALDLFRAAHAGHGDVAVAIAAWMQGAGLSLAGHSNPTAWKPGQVANIAGIQNCYRRYGGGATGMALRALAAGFDGQVLRYAGTIFGGLAHVVGRASSDAPGRDIDMDLLTAVLSGASQSEWMADIRREKGMGNLKWEFAAAAVVQRGYCEAEAEL